MNRADRLLQHLSPAPTAAAAPAPTAGSPAKQPTDVVILSALRTPIGRAKRGNLRETTPDDLLATVLRATMERTRARPEDIGDIVVGNVLQPGAGANAFRMGQLACGIPPEVPLSVVNRQCSSGLQALANVAGAIKLGQYEMGIAAGVESMSTNAMAGGPPPDVNWERVYENDAAKECLTPMGITSENVAERFGITREQQDAMAVWSHERAAAAQDQGLFDAEIVPVATTVTDENGAERAVTVSADEGIRRGTTAAKLAKLKPAFKEGGTTTAGNSSQVSDGAGAVLAASRAAAEARGMPVLGTIRAFAVAGCDPSIMGIGPAVAIPEALRQAGLTVDDIDIFEINEAFASQATYCCQHLGIPFDKVNPKGGAIALGHPLGCSGNRMVATLLHELRRRGQRYGVVSMCIGTGMGAAMVLSADD